MDIEQRVPTWVLVAAILVAAVLACTNDQTPERGLTVQQSWAVARAVSGHRVHVTKAKIACSKCHEMNGDSMGPVTPDACAACHQREARLKHAMVHSERRFGAGTAADCTLCHAFTVSGSGQASALAHVGAAPSSSATGGAFSLGLVPFTPGDCKRCHEKPQHKTPAVKVHGDVPCTDCHRPHDAPAPEAASCSGCHADVAATHTPKGLTATQACTTCHEHQHAPASAARSTCVPCHATRAPLVPASALFEKGHGECQSCHEPHRFEANQAIACRSCHALDVLGGPELAGHGRCTGCHAPHDVAGSARGSCARCHADVHSAHPKSPGVGTCTGCHEPHPKRAAAHASASACSSCHQFVDSDHGAHGNVTCTQCHRPHHFTLKLTKGGESCATCHAAPVHETARNPGHADCAGCHRGLPHQPAATPAGCESCHAAAHAAVNPGHTRCAQCHEPHSGRQAAPCASCHRAEHATAPAGHRTCTSCHEPHGGSPASKPCASCHADEARTGHGMLAAGCGTCHSPHGPHGPHGPSAPPPCTSCHDRAALPGLHREPRHADCTSCHSAHAHGSTELGTRKTCIGCHKDRSDHFPTAPRCGNCHLFGPSAPPARGPL